jgi:transcriptional regulator with XRE-family HTH domain
MAGTLESKQDAAWRALFRRRVGTELRMLREASRLSQQAVAEVFGWTRDAMSKVERGVYPLGMYEYLRLIAFYRDLEPDHPAVALANRLQPGVPPVQPRRRED